MEVHVEQHLIFFFSLSQVAESLIPTFIDDPEITLRREGVQLLLNQASELENEDQAVEAYEYALGKPEMLIKLKRHVNHSKA